MPPPIRYPLPTLIAFLLLSLLVWQGGDWIRGMREGLAAKWVRVVEGPPVPASAMPKVVAGPIIRRGLLLHDGTPVSSRPDSKPTDTISRRIFVDVYDFWPTNGPTEHFRVGNRNAIGWVAAGDCLAWDTRLVVRASGGNLKLAEKPEGPADEVHVGVVPLPVTGWHAGWIEVAVWDEKWPWSELRRRGWLKLSDLPRSAIGVLLAQDELPVLISMSLGAEDARVRDQVRLRAILGRVLDPVSWTEADVTTARAALPESVFQRLAAVDASERLAAANSSNVSDARWSGHSFLFVPLDDLP